MIKIDFSEQDLKTIEHERFNHPIPLVQRRMEVLWLKSPSETVSEKTWHAASQGWISTGGC